MSGGVLRWKREVVGRLLMVGRCNHRFAQKSPISTRFANCLHMGSHRRRESLIGVQERYKWEHGGSDEICNFFLKLNFVIKLVNFLCDIMNE